MRIQLNLHIILIALAACGGDSIDELATTSCESSRNPEACEQQRRLAGWTDPEEVNVTAFPAGTNIPELAVNLMDANLNTNLRRMCETHGYYCAGNHFDSDTDSLIECNSGRIMTHCSDSYSERISCPPEEGYDFDYEDHCGTEVNNIVYLCLADRVQYAEITGDDGIMDSFAGPGCYTDYGAIRRGLWQMGVNIPTQPMGSNCAVPVGFWAGYSEPISPNCAECLSEKCCDAIGDCSEKYECFHCLFDSGCNTRFVGSEGENFFKCFTDELLCREACIASF